MTTQNHRLNHQKEQNKNKNLFLGKSNFFPFKILFEWLSFQSILLSLRDKVVSFFQVRQRSIQYLRIVSNKAGILHLIKSTTRWN